MAYPRFMLAAASSGSGKTLLTCGILQALSDRGLSVASFKCGPDYIDPMFHSKVIRTTSRNLDTFFTDEETTRYLFTKTAAKADISVMEGVMGYYDGLGGISVKASSYDLASVTDTPVILLVNAKGMSISMLALIKGFLEYQPESRIRGVILNQIPEMLYPEMKERIENSLGIHCYGYIPLLKDFKLESRHLGLVLPDEIQDLQSNLKKLAQILEKTLELDEILKLAETAGEIYGRIPEFTPVVSRQNSTAETRDAVFEDSGNLLYEKPVIAVAKDEAFCFLYEDNLDLLQQMGAELVYFSPIHDQQLPKADGMLLYGGYPELFAKELYENEGMRKSVREAVESGMPCMAECGGFMYLQQEIEDMSGKKYPGAGAIPGSAYRTERLGRFGYITLTPQKSQMLGMDIGEIRGHEFHYFDSTECGDCFHAQKPLRKKNWSCIHGNENLLAGFPHLYYYSNPKIAECFLKKCMEYKKISTKGLL